MYRVLGRERIGLKRYGKYIVEFSTPWPSDAKTLYLVSEFTSWHPGAIRLKKNNSRGEVVVKLWSGIYHYMFVKNGYDYYVDRENPLILDGFKPFPEIKREFTVSVADIGVSAIKNLVGRGFHPEYIVHDERDSLFLSRYLDYIVIRLMTLRDEVDGVKLKIVCDGTTRTVPMDKILSNEYHDYYEAIVKCHRLRGYLFILEVDGEEISYGSEGVVENPAYIIPETISGVGKEEWFLGAVYYSIFVDSFAKSDYPIKPLNIIDDSIPRKRGYYGGDLIGIIKRIDYLKRLGVEVVYLTPIFSSTTYHRYDVVDYYEIDKYLGDEKTFRELVEKLHKENMKLILDIPLHHTSYCFQAFREALSKGARSRYWDWYIFLKRLDQVPQRVLSKLLKIIKSRDCSCNKSKLLRGIRPFYETFYGVWCMPKLNYDNAEVVDFIVNVLEYWSSLGVDGFRLDVSLGVPSNAMKAIYNAVRNQGKIVIGEVMSDPKYYLWENVYDSAMNYELRRLIIDFFYYKKLIAKEFVRRVMEQYVQLPPYRANILYNLLESHDTMRIKSIIKDRDKLKQVYAFLFAAYGSPSIYYGGEIGLEGGEDPDNRRPMLWNEKLWDKELLEHIRKLIELKKRSKVLRYGFFRIYDIDGNIIVKRFLDNEEVLVLFNTSSDYFTFQLIGNDRVLYGSNYTVGKDMVYMTSNGFVFLHRNTSMPL